jgi:tetratricopeptide (TPR) repeat protein
MNTKLSVFAQKIIEAGWLAAAVSVPLFFNIYTARTFEPDKITLLRAIVVVMVLAWLVWVLERGGLRLKENNLLKIPLFIPTLALVVIYLLSTIVSLSPPVSFWGSYQRMQGAYSFLSYVVIFVLMAGFLRSREQVDRLVTVVIVTSIPVSLYGIVQRYGLDPLPWAGNVTVRVASNMGNAIFVASYLIMIIPLTFSRLIESMTAIIREENASWGHTILAAVYIFTLAIQFITIAFSQSRGPMLGILGGLFVMGLLILLLLRRADQANSLSIAEVATGLVFVAALTFAAVFGGGLGYLAGLGLQKLLFIDALPLLGAALGGGLGFAGLYIYMVAGKKGWRWLWVSWLGMAGLGIGFILLLNLRGTSMDTFLEPVRQLPYVNRLANVVETEGTGRVRILIWDAAMELAAPHSPIGIPDDDISPPDRLNALRPLLGYGPESMFNAFAYVYPPGLAHVENRGSSADRSHNETMDSLVITGVVGFVAFYFLMVTLFYYVIKWLGWASHPVAKRQVFIFLLVGGIVGAIAPYFLDSDGSPYTFVPLGLPLGLVAGTVLYLSWRAIGSQINNQAPFDLHQPLLLVGLFGAIVGHFIEVHFVFSIAATYTYFWLYAGLLVALARISETTTPATVTTGVIPAENSPAEMDEPTLLAPEPTIRRGRKSRTRSKGRRTPLAGSIMAGNVAESLDVWVGSLGLAMAIILIILNFDFITPRFQFSWADKDSMSLLWMYMITWLVGLAIAMASVAVRRDAWAENVNWLRAGLLYALTSLGYFFFYSLAHRIQFSRQITVTSLEDIIRAANIFVNGLVLFYGFMFALMLLFAVILVWRHTRGLALWRADLLNLVLYILLVLAAGGIIWFKNINVVRADIYLKEGERYRNSQQWNEAIALHELARSVDSDEDFYYLMLALDYQLMAQDSRLEQPQRELAWQQGEQIALEARRINPYNPDNTGNMGRYYFTLGQVFDPARFADALSFFNKATMLAPSNVIYHNLWAQTYYIMQDYQAAVDRLKVSAQIDPLYPPTWVLLGDTYAATGNVDEAFAAHREAMGLAVRGSDGFATFADQFLDQRLNFYISAGRLEDIVAAMQQVAPNRPDAPQIPWAIGHAYNLAGQPAQAVSHLEQARALGDTSDRTGRELANTYLALQAFDQALLEYKALVQYNPRDVEAHSAMAFIFAQQGRLDEAIQENQQVLQQAPNDYDSLKNLAILYQQKGQWQEALTAAQQAQAAAPETDQPSWEQFITDLQNRIAGSG